MVVAAGLALLLLSGCESTPPSYTKRHCDAFEQAWAHQDLSAIEEVLELAFPPDGREVVDAVHDAAFLVSFAVLGDPPRDADVDSQAIRADVVAAYQDLVAKCAQVTE